MPMSLLILRVFFRKPTTIINTNIASESLLLYVCVGGNRYIHLSRIFIFFRHTKNVYEYDRLSQSFFTKIRLDGNFSQNGPMYTVRRTPMGIEKSYLNAYAVEIHTNILLWSGE